MLLVPAIISLLASQRTLESISFHSTVSQKGVICIIRPSCLTISTLKLCGGLQLLFSAWISCVGRVSKPTILYKIAALNAVAEILKNVRVTHNLRRMGLLYGSTLCFYNMWRIKVEFYDGFTLPSIVFSGECREKWAIRSAAWSHTHSMSVDDMSPPIYLVHAFWSIFVRQKE